MEIDQYLSIEVLDRNNTDLGVVEELVRHMSEMDITRNWLSCIWWKYPESYPEMAGDVTVNKRGDYQLDNYETVPALVKFMTNIKGVTEVIYLYPDSLMVYVRNGVPYSHVKIKLNGDIPCK